MKEALRSNEIRYIGAGWAWGGFRCGVGDGSSSNARETERSKNAGDALMFRIDVCMCVFI